MHANSLAACTGQSPHHISSCTTARFSHSPQLRVGCRQLTALILAIGCSLQHLLAPPPTPFPLPLLTPSGSGQRRRKVRQGNCFAFAASVLVCVDGGGRVCQGLNAMSPVRASDGGGSMFSHLLVMVVTLNTGFEVAVCKTLPSLGQICDCSMHLSTLPLTNLPRKYSKLHTQT